MQGEFGGGNSRIKQQQFSSETSFTKQRRCEQGEMLYREHARFYRRYLCYTAINFIPRGLAVNTHTALTVVNEKLWSK